VRALAPTLVFDWQIPTLTGILEARAGNRAASAKALAGLRKVDDGTLHFQFAQLHARRGEIADALASVEAAYRTKAPGPRLHRRRSVSRPAAQRTALQGCAG
jgi:hypothetical protein